MQIETFTSYLSVCASVSDAHATNRPAGPFLDAVRTFLAAAPLYRLKENYPALVEGLRLIGAEDAERLTRMLVKTAKIIETEDFWTLEHLSVLDSTPLEV